MVFDASAGGASLALIRYAIGSCTKLDDWLLLAQRDRRALVRFLYALAMGYSRVAVYAHSWPQVVMGWLVGGCLVASFLWFDDLSKTQWSTLPLVTCALLLCAVTWGTLEVSVSTIRAIPAERLAAWSQYAVLNSVDSSGPASLRGVVPPLGGLVGFLLGARLDFRSAPLPLPTLRVGVRRTLMGGMALSLSYALVQWILTWNGDEHFSLMVRGIGAFLMCGLISGGLPALFRGTGQADAG